MVEYIEIVCPAFSLVTVFFYINMDNSIPDQSNGTDNQAKLVPYNPEEWQAKRDQLRKQIEESIDSGVAPTIGRFLLACLSAVPIVGGAIGGAGGYWSEKDQSRINDLFDSWMKLQEDEIREIGRTLFEVLVRLDKEDPIVLKRIESPEYLSLVKKAFRDWSAAESEEKRILIRNLLANAGTGNQLCPDDIIRLFIRWIDIYDEAHFKVIRAVYNNSGITRKGIWDKIDGKQVREDSAEADLFKFLINDLSQGHIIRQHREVDYYGNFIKPQPNKKGSGSGTYTSAFEDEKQYELTELGNQFVHYTMNEIVPKISAPS